MPLTRRQGRTPRVRRPGGLPKKDANCITLHYGLSRRDKIDYPDRMIIDLDPSSSDFSMVKFAAFRLKDLLDDLELESFVQLTGSRGMHIVVPLDRSENFDRVHAFAREIAERLAERHPRELTVEQRKGQRGRRVFLDYMRNSRAQTGVAPYAVRAREGAPVAAPITWEEARTRGICADKYDIKTIFRALAKRGDPWSRIDRHPNSLKKARVRLEAIQKSQV